MEFHLLLRNFQGECVGDIELPQWANGSPKAFIQGILLAIITMTDVIAASFRIFTWNLLLFAWPKMAVYFFFNYLLLSE